jgi:hypothetical protein
MTRGVAIGLAVAGVLGGCQSWGGIPDDELTAAPIAIHYRTFEQARKRAEALAEREGAAPPTGGPRIVGSKANVRADMNALGSFLSEALGLQASEPGADRGRLALIDPRTGDVEVVASALPGAIPLDWSPDHERLLFAQLRDPEIGDVQVFEWDRVRETVRRLTHAPPRHTQACYGPEGRIVATAAAGRGEATRSWIRISQPGGRGPWLDLSEGPTDHSPACDSAGTTIAFVRALDGGRSEIRAIDAPFDAGSRRLAPGFHPRFSARGAWLIYTAPLGRSSHIARVRSDGTGRAPIGRGRGREAWPAPSPGGEFVAYVASERVDEETLRHRLMVRRFDGSGDRVLLVTGEAEYPV